MRLAIEPDLEVIGEAADGKTAIDLAKSLCPDIVLIDVDMPRIDGIAAASRLHVLCPDTLIVILSMHDDPLTRERAESAGAAAFVAKSMPTDILLKTIREVV